MDSTKVMSVEEIIQSRKKTDSPIEWRLLNEMRKYGLEPETQVQIGEHRVDFLLTTEFRKIVIEADGKDYHQDKGKDELRDCELRMMGYDVLRFAGFEIHYRPFLCVARIMEEISEIYSTDRWQDILMKAMEQSLNLNHAN